MAKFGPIYWKAFRAWLKEPLGQTLIQQETEELNELVNKLFGYHLLLIGDVAFLPCLKNCPINHKVWVHTHIMPVEELSPLTSRLDKLAILSDEIDVVFLAHSLEFLQNPHEALREAYRVIKSEGHVIITCFNPWSLWGLWRRIMHYIKRVPWDGHFISMYRLKDWLALLGFDIIQAKTCLFRPPINNDAWLNKFMWMENMGRWVWPFLGAVNVVMAKKRVITLTPIRQTFKEKRRELSTGLVEPAARVEIEK